MSRRARLVVLPVLCLLVVGGFVLYRHGRSLWVPILIKIRGGRTVAEVMRDVGPAARGRLSAHFDRVGAHYPPAGVTLVAYKSELELELWTAPPEPCLIRTYRILGASGGPGPKLREGDRQVPEGDYRLVDFNPNSSYHLSMKLDYPNDFDRAMALADGRTDLGGDIFIHGKTQSIGCLAMGDEAIEELFVLAYDVGLSNVRVLIVPSRLSANGSAWDATSGPPWLAEHYVSLADQVRIYRSQGR